MNNEGQIIRAKTRHYTHLPNEILQSTQLSWKAKGLLCYLLSMRDDWVVHLSHLYTVCKVKGNGRAAVREAFKELQEAGYIMSQRVKSEGSNLYSGWRHIVYDSTQNPERNESIVGTVFVGTEPRRYEDQPLINTKGLITTDQNKDQASGLQSELEIFPTFDQFWDRYDKKVDLEKCKKAWSKIKQSDREAIMIYLEDYIPATEDKTYRRNPLTFLNKKTWLNELINKQSASRIVGNSTAAVTNAGTLERLHSYQDEL